MKLYAIKHNIEDLYFFDISAGYSSFYPLCLIETLERAKWLIEQYLSPDEQQECHIVEFDLILAGE